MKSTSAVILAALALAHSAFAQSNGILVTSPPSLVTCEPAALSWSGGTAPYYVSIIPGGSPGAAALETFPTQQGNTFTWSPVNLPAGESITIQVRDSTGAVQYSSPITIAAGPDQSCVGQSLSGGATSTAAGSVAVSTPAAATTSAAMSMSMAPVPVSSAAATSAMMTTTSAMPMMSSASSMSTMSTKASAMSSGSAASSASKASTTPSAAASGAASSSFKIGAFSIAGLAGLLGAALF